ncbi:MAG: Coenzyme F420 hydrogenase/dehydrogenase, beta subunit C-terminal domain [Clostridiales bacterium]|nr:Coenzyme F420 hydrogenase/dehydrogenase, beta subunit C-terminal domain [Clostridiales bacterium]MCF8021947.1 Coenzyme F420 hydrogenase/dehydrogenase, beta subunit C-terminal domain [Clostridiales bacterium]
MQSITTAVQNSAKKLLEENKVDVVIGFKKGTIPLRSTPVFIRDSNDADKLEWNYYCENNLANYLRNKDQKIGVVVKGCDSRSIVALMKENQLTRDNLYLIGVPCSGMIDRKKVNRIIGDKEILETNCNEDSLIIKTKDSEQTIKLNEVMHNSCLKCNHKNPVIYDEMVAEPVSENSNTDFSEIKEFEEKPAEERKNFFIEELSKCIRCYACRNSCPMCYCQECFVDSTNPEWIGKSAENVQDNLFFQAVRVFHLAGRCVDCGACERACPMDINLGLLTRKLYKDTTEMFNTEAGANLEDAPALSTYNMDDPQPFLLKE